MNTQVYLTGYSRMRGRDGSDKVCMTENNALDVVLLVVVANHERSSITSKKGLASGSLGETVP